MKAKEIIIQSQDKMPGHYDGELYFPKTDSVKFSVIEKAIDIIY
jgi:diacylglycerol kinase family enzyme